MMSPARILTKRFTNKGAGRIASVLEAARDIIIEEGSSGLTYRNIAKRAKMSVGNLNYYYPSKDVLMADLAHFIFDQWSARFRRRIPTEMTDRRAVFRLVIESMIADNTKDKSLYMLMDIWAMANHSTSVATMLDAFHANMRRWIADMILQAAPELADKGLAVRAALVTAQLEGLMVLSGPRRPLRDDLAGLDSAALRHIELLAFE